MFGKIINKQQGNSVIGLLLVLFFIIALALYNAPNTNITNKVAWAYGGDGGSGSGEGGGGGGGTESRPHRQTATVTPPPLPPSGFSSSTIGLRFDFNHTNTNTAPGWQIVFPTTFFSEGRYGWLSTPVDSTLFPEDDNPITQDRQLGAAPNTFVATVPQPGTYLVIVHFHKTALNRKIKAEGFSLGPDLNEPSYLNPKDSIMRRAVVVTSDNEIAISFGDHWRANGVEILPPSDPLYQIFQTVIWSSTDQLIREGTAGLTEITDRMGRVTYQLQDQNQLRMYQEIILKAINKMAIAIVTHLINILKNQLNHLLLLI